MALSTPRAASSLSRQLLRSCGRPRCEVSTPLAIIPVLKPSRSLSTTCPRCNYEDRPRWSYTPEAMKGNMRLNPIRNPVRTQWKVNEDPQKLDAMYDRFLGLGGHRLLSEETKWLAITHKSFDQGRRGFNDRLAYFGRNIIVQEAAMYILALDTPRLLPDSYGRDPFSHPALNRTNNFQTIQPAELMDKSKIAKLAIETGVNYVMRWKPRLPENLNASGQQIVLNQVVFAIIGAVSLEKGSATASLMVRERIFKKTHGFS